MSETVCRCGHADSEHHYESIKTPYALVEIAPCSQCNCSTYEKPSNSDLSRKRTQIALDICNSESFMWLMVGSNHVEGQLESLRSAWKAFCDVNGGWGKEHLRQKEE